MSFQKVRQLFHIENYKALWLRYLSGMLVNCDSLTCLFFVAATVAFFGQGSFSVPGPFVDGCCSQ